jgi:hypothetical protein
MSPLDLHGKSVSVVSSIGIQLKFLTVTFRSATAGTPSCSISRCSSPQRGHKPFPPHPLKVSPVPYPTPMCPPQCCCPLLGHSNPSICVLSFVPSSVSICVSDCLPLYIAGSTCGFIHPHACPETSIQGLVYHECGIKLSQGRRPLRSRRVDGKNATTVPQTEGQRGSPTSRLQW